MKLRQTFVFVHSETQAFYFKFDSYGSGYFPGIGDLLYDFDNQTEEEQKIRLVTLKKHVSQLMVVILRAVDHLKEVYRL